MVNHPTSGDRVAFLLPGSREYVEVALLALRQGVVPVPLDPRLTERERSAVLADVAPALVVEDLEGLRALAAALDGAPTSPVPLARPMHLTSGTTGAPKGVWSGLLTPSDAEALVA